MPDDWSWTPDETGLDEEALDPAVAREFGLWDGEGADEDDTVEDPPGTLPDAFYEALESYSDDDEDTP